MVKDVKEQEFPEYNITANWTFDETGLIWPKYRYSFHPESFVVVVTATSNAVPEILLDIAYDDIRKMLTLADEVQDLKRMITELIKKIEEQKDE